jgi:hypothetical protein
MMFSAMAMALLTLSAAIYLVTPLFESHAPAEESATARENARLDLATRQASVYATLKELDFDLASGKLSEEDHKELSERYTAEAVEILEKMDALATNRKGVPKPSR